MGDTQDAIDNAVALARMQAEIAGLREDNESLNSRLRGLEKEKDNAFRWGIYMLGSAVLGLILFLLDASGIKVVH